uniref:Uncharacterized protein n=1 Tax=Arundo donax TaxID=35708 RepID=A0A0A9CMX8_ARUDO
MIFRLRPVKNSSWGFHTGGKVSMSIILRRRSHTQHLNQAILTPAVYAFRDSSLLSNGTPRFEEYTSDGDIPATEKAAALNDDSERYAAVCNEVNTMEMDLILGSTSRQRGHGDIDTNVSLTPVECTNDEGRQKTPVASMKRQACRKKLQHISLNEKAVPDEDMPTLACLDVQSPGKPVGQSKEQRSAHEKLQSATRSPSTISPACFPISAYAWQDRVIVSSHT